MTTTSGAVATNRTAARSTGQFGVIVFLASDVMLFASFFAAYFLLRSTNSPWPAEGAEIDLPRALAFTIALVPHRSVSSRQIERRKGVTAR